MIHYKRRPRFLLFIISLLVFAGGAGILLIGTDPATAEQSGQLPTVSMATVTSTAFGAYITVNLDQDFVNVRTGPSTLYPKVGMLLSGQTAPAKGRNGEWILIDYPGVITGMAWVYGPNITLFGAVPIIEPPPTPTPLVTATIDATLAAQFITVPESTRLPTYTSAPTIAIPKFSDEAGGGSLPIGWIILFTGLLGIILGLLSLFQSR